MSSRAGFTRTLLLKVGVDTVLFVLSYLTAFILRVGAGPEYMEVMLFAILPVVGIKVAIFSMFGCYRSIWRYSSLRDLENLVKASLFSMVGIVVFGFFFFDLIAIPRSIPFIDLCFTLLLTGGLRSIVRGVDGIAGTDVS